MQDKSPCRRTFSIDTDHSPYFSAPERLAEILVSVDASPFDDVIVFRWTIGGGDSLCGVRPPSVRPRSGSPDDVSAHGPAAGTSAMAAQLVAAAEIHWS